MVDSQNPNSLTNSKEESYNIFPYCCNLDFIVDFIPNIVGNNKENQPSLNGATTSNSLVNSTIVPMVQSTPTLENSIPTVDEGLAHSFPSIEAQLEHNNIEQVSPTELVP